MIMSIFSIDSGQAYRNLRKEGSKKDRLPFSLLVQQANLLEGIASEQADGLTNLFGEKVP